MKIIFFLLSLVICTSAKAAQTECGPYNVSIIQSENPGVLVFLRDTNGNEVVKALGTWQDPWTKSFQAIAQQALATDKKVVLRFIHDTSEYKCNETQYYNSKPYMIRILK
ncbi:hypothetical protein [Acinetobacter bereziniae]|uniref:hypothetical protein n=1 Tax=Acinetobacter bereziniae TaxID=106648 RepID=UPI00125EF7E2|nr:hypothetical protein [Acinetobacter bereziniae]MBJ9901588.1 hypothetical protein [Acinetobacter bereziniae]MCU4318054.1 hypothetical protein [Acinetobacter bereziniae]MCU4598588.1 hypothetical protein [Acinetobacter bereziniae]